MEPETRNCCPKCGLELLEFSYGPIRIDQCSGCDGIWLDRGELERIETMKKESLFSVELEAKWAMAREEQRKRSAGEQEELRQKTYMRCPRCSCMLAETAENGVTVDRCTGCGGVWLDAGELDQVAGTKRLMARLHRFIHRG